MKELLIVEDDLEMQEFYKDMLQGEPFTVTIVSNAEEGLKKIKEKNIRFGNIGYFDGRGDRR